MSILAWIKHACGMVLAATAAGAMLLIWMSATIAVLVGAYTYGMTQNAARSLDLVLFVVDGQKLNAALLLLVEMAAIGLTTLAVAKARAQSWRKAWHVAGFAFVCSLASFTSTWGFLSMERTDAMLERGDHADARAALVARLEKLKKERGWSTVARSPAQIAALIADAESDPIFTRADRTEGCKPEKITREDSREFCRAYRALLAERDDSGRLARYDEQIKEVEIALAGMRSIAVADPLASELQKVFGLAPDTTGLWRPVILAILVHAVAIFGLPLSAMAYELVRPDPLPVSPKPFRGLTVTVLRPSPVQPYTGPAPFMDGGDAPYHTEIKPVEKAQEVLPEVQTSALSPADEPAPDAPGQGLDSREASQPCLPPPQTQKGLPASVVALKPVTKEQGFADWLATIEPGVYFLGFLSDGYSTYCSRRNAPRLGPNQFSAALRNAGMKSSKDRKSGNLLQFHIQSPKKLGADRNHIKTPTATAKDGRMKKA